MSNYNSELLDVEMEVEMKDCETLENVSEHHSNLQRAEEKKLNQVRCPQEQKNTLFDTNDLQMNNCHGENFKNVTNIEASTYGTDNYSELDLIKYLKIDSPPSCLSKQYVENGRNQSIDEFFNDFYEIVSSETKTTSKVHEQSVATLHPSHMHILDYQSEKYNSSGSNISFNLDLQQFDVDAPHKSDLTMLQSPGIAASFPSHLHLQPENKLIGSYSAIRQSSSGQEATEFSQVNADILENGQLKQFYSDFNGNGGTETTMYVDQASNDMKEEGNGQSKQFYSDFKRNCDVAKGSNDYNSIITYMKKEGADARSLQYINDNVETETIMYNDQASNDLNKERIRRIEYINDSGEMETVMYVDQASNDLKEGKVQRLEYTNDSEETLVYVDQESNDQDVNTNVVGNEVKYEIIHYDANQSGNADSTWHNYQISSLPVENVNSSGQSQDTIYQPDLLSSLLMNKNNKIIIIAKPLKNPKVRQDELHSKFKEIDASTPNIPFLKRPTIKGCRKQKLELINRTDLPVLESPERRGRPKKINKAVLCNATFTQETPKMPSKYIRDHKKKHASKTKKSKKT